MFLVSAAFSTCSPLMLWSSASLAPGLQQQWHCCVLQWWQKRWQLCWFSKSHWSFAHRSWNLAKLKSSLWSATSANDTWLIANNFVSHLSLSKQIEKLTGEKATSLAADWMLENPRPLPCGRGQRRDSQTNCLSWTSPDRVFCLAHGEGAWCLSEPGFISESSLCYRCSIQIHLMNWDV